MVMSQGVQPMSWFRFLILDAKRRQYRLTTEALQAAAEHLAALPRVEGPLTEGDGDA